MSVHNVDRNRAVPTGFLLIAGLILATFGARGDAEPGTSPDLVRPGRLAAESSMPRLRPLTPGARRLLESGARQSSIVAGLVKRIEASDLVVYLTDEMTQATGGPTAHTVFLSNGGETRYLLIRLNLLRMMLTDRIPALGHELQHALEIAAAPEVRDSPTMATLYRRIGWEAEKGQYESEAARTISLLIRRQTVGGGV